MSVVVEFTVDGDEFAMGQLFAGDPGMHVELERIVPSDGAVIPFVWVQGDEYAAFEQHVRESPSVAEFTALDRLDGMVLYRVEWDEDPNSMVESIANNEGVILEAEGDEEWSFRVRFPDHNSLSQFYNFCTEHDVNLHIDRSYTLTERVASGNQFDLSQQQREALLLGLNRGYFETPSEVSLSELADELGITQQAMSNRVRRGTKRVLEEALLDSATDD